MKIGGAGEQRLQHLRHLVRRDQINGLGLQLTVEPGQIRFDLRQLVANPPDLDLA